jgi:hypothetical protein
MLRATDDVLELRHWAEERGGFPCRRPDGGPALCFDAAETPGLAVDWGEFEASFVLGRYVCVYDDGPGARRSFIGSRDEARAFIGRHEASGPGPRPAVT